MTAPKLDRVATLMEELALEIRNSNGSSKESLPSLREHEAECNSTAREREKEKPMLTASPSAALPMLMTRTEVAELLRIDDRTLDRWRADPRMRFPTPLKRSRVVRWRREQIDRWIEAKTP